MTDNYKYLKNRIESITDTFNALIPNDPLEQEGDEHQNLIKSYILLCHAEFEKYFEDLCLEVIKTAKSTFDSSNKTTIPLLCLSLMMKKEFNKESAKERLDKLYSNYHALIKDNNGIKKNDIIIMLNPICLFVEEISDLYLEKLDCFGKKRGDIAHNSQSSMQYRYNFRSEIADITIILDETLEQIDKRLETYL